MERIELEQWIEQHYEELLAVAKQKHRRAPEDALHDAIARMLSSETGPGEMGLWPWAVSAIRSTAGHKHLSDRRQRALKGEAKNIRRAGASLGQRQERGRYEAPLSDDSAKYLKLWARETREAFGNARRRSHKGDPGVTFGRFGPEDQKMGARAEKWALVDSLGRPVRGRPATPWTEVSQSTGRQNPTGYKGSR